MKVLQQSAESKTKDMPQLISLCGDMDDESLVSQIVSSVPFYDEDSTLNISGDIADGLLIFLSGGKKNAGLVCSEEKKKKSKKSSKKSSPATPSPSHTIPEGDNIQLAFATITDGNIVDAVFGVQTCGGLKKHKETSQYAYNSARAAKEAIRDASDSSESIKLLAINTYSRCFEIVIIYHNSIEELGLLTWCYKHQKIYDKARANLRKAFKPLAEAVNASI